MKAIVMRCAALAAAVVLVLAQSALAQEKRVPFNIPAQPLDAALKLFQAQSGAQVLYAPEVLAGRQGAAVSGELTALEAARQLLKGTGLEAAADSGGRLTIRPAAKPAADQQLPEVKVQARTEPSPSALPRPYAGGQVARGGRIGVTGNADYMDVPMSITTFTSEFRDNTQALSVSDMLKYSVSAQTPQMGPTNTTDVIYVRGFNIGTYDGTFDGLPGLLGRMPPMEAVERVELLLGTSAFANGQPFSVGGNINIVPKRAGEEPLYRLGVNYRTESILGTSVDLGRRFGPDNSFGLRVNLAYSDGDTELEDGRRRTYSRALAFDHRSPTTRFNFDYMGNDRRLPAEAWFVINPGFAVPDAGRASRDFRQPWTVYKDWWDTAVARGEWDFAPRWTVSAAYGHIWTKVDRRSQVSEIIDNDGNMVDAFGGSFAHSKQRREGYAGEVALRGEFATGPITHRPRLGYTSYGDKSGYAATGSADYIPFASNVYSPVDYPDPDVAPPDMPSVYDSKTRNTSVFVADEIVMFDERLRLLLGARQVQYRSEFLDAATGVWAGDPAIKKWSPALGVLWKPVPRVALYANRLQALDAGYRVEPPAVNAGEVLPPLPADQTEVGVKADFGKVGATAALFEIDKPSYFLNPVTGIEGSNGRQVNRGLELALFGQPVSGLRLYSSATYLDPKMKQTPGGTFDGRTAVSAARFMANAYADWDVPAVEGLALLGGVSYSGSVYNDEANTQEIRPWTRFDVGLRYRTVALGKATVFRLTIDNVLDKQYWVSERGTIYMAPGRTLGISMSMDM